MVLAVGGQCLGGDESDRASVGEAIRMSTGFAGGLGDTGEELCGALSGGVMVIGALLGRARPKGDDQPAISTAARYRRSFLQEFGYTQCSQLREHVVEAPGRVRCCAALVERAAVILLDVLDESM